MPHKTTQHKFIDVEQNTDVWEALRIGKATASNFGTIMANCGQCFGEPAKRYALQIALERITGRKNEYSFANEHTERGHAQEPIARQLYEEEFFCKVKNGGFFDCGEFGDSPDGLIGEYGVVEFKSVIAPVHFDNLRRGSFDPAYKWQLIGHLECTGREWVDFASYCAEFPKWKQLFVDRLHRSDYLAEIELLINRRAEFLEMVKDIEIKLMDGS